MKLNTGSRHGNTSHLFHLEQSIDKARDHRLSYKSWSKDRCILYSDKVRVRDRDRARERNCDGTREGYGPNTVKRPDNEANPETETSQKLREKESETKLE